MALTQFAEHGPTGVTGQSIARAAKVHHEQVQQMFGSFESLLTSAPPGALVFRTPLQRGLGINDADGSGSWNLDCSPSATTSLNPSTGVRRQLCLAKAPPAHLLTFSESFGTPVDWTIAEPAWRAGATTSDNG